MAQTNNVPFNMGKKPMFALQKDINKEVTIKLKNSLVYKGLMLNVDIYMNVYLQNADEYNEEGKRLTNYGDIIIRGNNILYIQANEGLLK
ncbi:MAG: ribonucleoprotein [Nitrososphaerota archaeon]|nr:ribonucleoprotein [Nitrososphaerota archaeon]MDG7035651.1 ribonucleoprotein [Nitrososphaerota archaeon]MDG7040809.1 ribonucleoprotein [Nitrososphaerota archaeon]MDG7044907.1 ribonucleoprotein [Nitrososphaerota archaeon]MDG7046322.1 ribonucleoprotein [Nitrososphaerota archaeon]